MSAHCSISCSSTPVPHRDLGLPEAHIRAADPKLYFANVGDGR
jgi:hypothetical protein